MIALKSYKTSNEIEVDLAAAGIALLVEDTYASLRNVLEIDSWGDDQIYFQCNENQYCCAFDELGQFSVGYEENKDFEKYWPYLLKAFLLYNKPRYLRCSTLPEKRWDALNNALFEVGFTPCGSVKSNHGHYKVNLWEYYG